MSRCICFFTMALGEDICALVPGENRVDDMKGEVEIGVLGCQVFQQGTEADDTCHAERL